jgi:preprotein translocase subunit SecD
MSNLIYLIPMMIANAMPVIVRHIPYLSIPIYAPLLGANKTRRGLIAGIAGATIVWYMMIYI